MSERTPCIARLQIQAKAVIFQNPSGALPSGVRPLQTAFAIAEKDESPVLAVITGIITAAPSRNMLNINGEHQLENVAKLLNPKVASVTTTAPTAITTATNRQSVG